jgi:hypothetical protein
MDASGATGDRPQVSWKAIEADADVVTADGSTAARVSRVVGDPDADVFSGLAVVPGALGGERFVAAERVTGIWEDRVEIDLTREALEGLPEYEDAPVVRWQPERAGFLQRLFRRGPR